MGLFDPPERHRAIGIFSEISSCDISDEGHCGKEEEKGEGLGIGD